MALTSDTFIERAHLKKQVLFWRLAAVGVAVFFLILLVERNAKMPTVVKSDYIARLTIADMVLEDQRLYDLLDEVRDDDNAKALILTLDTPGGAAVAGEVIHQKIKEISKKKPVVASMRSLCASAGYMIAIAADHVLAMRGTITGSIGVLFQSAELSELAAKVGVKPIIVKSGAFKGSPSMAEPITLDERAVIQSMIDEFHTVFVRMVAKDRDLSEAKVRDIADGRIYSAVRAKELGLIDDLGGEPEALAWLKDEKKIDTSLEIKDMKIKSKLDTLYDRFAEVTGMDQLQNTLPTRSGLMLLWRPDLLANTSVSLTTH
jgi:protease-4